MFGDIECALRKNLREREYAEEYAKSFLDSYIATQIKVIREQRGLTQAELGNHVGTTQAGVSRYEDVNYSSWSLRTLVKIARAFDVRLRVSFEPYGTLPEEVVRFDRTALERESRENDRGLGPSAEELEVVDELLAKSLSGEKQIRVGDGVVSIDSHHKWSGSNGEEKELQEVLGGEKAYAAWSNY
jgi:transcriptional regulator with XRE-family HTH domain